MIDIPAIIIVKLIMATAAHALKMASVSVSFMGIC
jgi:hypothetical protein